VDLAIFAGSNNASLAEAVAAALRVPLRQRLLERSPDGELHVEIRENVRACDVFLVQPTGPPLDRNIMELLFLADACRRSGANHITAITPYFGYARQDRNSSGQQAVGARLIPDLLRTAGIGRVVAVDLHTTSVESAFGIALEHLSAFGLFQAALGRPSPDSVVVAPDLGAFRLAERYAHALGLPLAIIAKMRVSGEEVIAQSIIGDVRGRKPLIVDDMIISGATVEAALNKVIAAGASADATIVATHGLLVGPAIQRLKNLPISRILVSDSVELPSDSGLPIEPITLGPLLGQVVSRLHAGESLSDLK
jgi:ribose-phosphate pyrophosphokinase